MSADLRIARHDHIGLITLTRPQALNALNLAMIQTMQRQLLQWQIDDSIHAVVIMAEGDRAFCAGGDVRWLYEAGRAHDPQQMQFFWHEYRLNHFIHRFGKPYISLMNGITMGGGVGISLHGSHPVASERFHFAMPETGIGFFPDIGASYLLAGCPDYFGMYLGLTCHRLNASEALACRLVKQIVSSEQFPALLSDLIEADLSRNAFERVDGCILKYALTLDDAAIFDHKEIINSCFNHDNVEAIISSLNQMDHQWAADTARQLLQKSPLSLKVTFEQIRKAQSLSMGECVKMDYRLVGHFMQDSDFYEGVRALLVDKDKSPKWQPDSLEKVTAAKVADYFECGQQELSLITDG
ncbi:enoyl-CoA hydratase/isomerase family protein [Legionella spiritensis]|uniref:3-hydroxyisobutyryl-CoA hydrolase n=1 Tax=Legionella spiritensis TaxID=452 RepID=A0A0W0Z8R1_LEGSP|nr:enoyl-CoA hydratase/isomerase family protein [Legionella spiritensis]KTD65515.1 Enoyl-CoA hydratase/carnithine racemase [Legionella spiritensis]SNV36075.1 enoyl-CoA hydratase/carnithine racemase [Legionella spiritensis]